MDCCQIAETNADKTNLPLLTETTHSVPLRGTGGVLSARSRATGEDLLQQTEVAR